MFSNFMLAIVACCLIAVFALTFLKISRTAQRKIYWSAACIAGISGALATYPTWDNAAKIGMLLLAIMIFIAYGCTPYIKIGGKIYSLILMDPDPEDKPTSTEVPAAREIDSHPNAYSGLITATTLWWLLLVPAATASANVYFAATGESEMWVGLMSGTFLALLTVVTAYGDASWRYPIARGQYVQFGVNTVITAGAFALVYLAAYYTAQRHPIRRKQSMEYRAHPRHRNWDN